MTKKTYIQPSINVVQLQHHEQLLGLSSVHANYQATDMGWGYDQTGGNPYEAW